MVSLLLPTPGSSLPFLFGLTLLHISQDLLTDFAQNFRRQPLAEIYHQGRAKGQLFIIVIGITSEILQIRVFLDLQSRFFV